MKVLYSYLKEDINMAILGNINEMAIISIDKSTSYVNISDLAEVHIVDKPTKETTNLTLLWVYFVISNARRTQLDI